MKPRLALFLFLIPVAGAQAQTTWHVDALGTPPGTGTAADPYTSIQYAFDQAATQAGDTLLVAPGTYVENLDMRDNWPAEFVSVVGAAGPLETFLVPAAAGDVAFLDRITLEGFTITGATGGAAVHVPWGGQADVVRCIVEGNEIGFHQEYDGTLLHCTVVNNELGLRIDFDGILGFQNSILWNNTTALTKAPNPFAASWFCASYSVVPWGSEDPLMCTVEGNLYVDPELWDVDGRDLHLIPGSPCIDAGVPGHWFPGATDPDGSPLDIGVLIYDPTYAPPPVTYCEAAPNSVGDGAHMSASGGPSITANEFTLHVADAPPGKFGKFYYGGEAAQVLFGDGFRCVGGGATGTYRLLPPLLTDANGSATRPVDFGAPPAGSGPGRVLAGSTWYFQFWHRDAQGPGGTGFNLSGGLRASFAP